MDISRKTSITAGSAMLWLLAGCSGNSVSLLEVRENPYSMPAPDRSYAMVAGQEVPIPDIKMGDTEMVEDIILEGQSSRVMEHLTYLTQEIGARLTGSQAQEDAAYWAKGQFESFGLDNVSLFEWGTIATRFDRGPSTGTVFVGGKDEAAREMQLSTLAWIKGTDGPVKGPVVRMPRTEEEFNAVKDSLAGAWIMVPTQYAGDGGQRRARTSLRGRHTERAEMRERLEAGEVDFNSVAEPATDLAEGHTRWSGTFDYDGSLIPTSIDLTDLAGGSITGVMSIEGFHKGPIEDAAFDAESGELIYAWETPMGTSQYALTVEEGSATGSATASSGTVYAVSIKKTDPDATVEPGEAILAMVLKEGPAGFMSSSRDERVWTSSKNGWRKSELADYADDIEVNVRASDYDFINSRLADGAQVEVEFDLEHRLVAGPFAVHNVMAEIVGSEFPDEIVIMSGHLDSWDGPGSEGCIDNGTGSSVVLEAARILVAAGARPKRTIRFILWTGEEQGLLGSRAYVKSLSEQELSKISAVFVDDGGTNYQGGARVADQMADYMAAASAPMNGRFFSQTDYDTAMSDDNPDNDADAGLLRVNITTVGKTLGEGGGSDHASFNAVGVPGFFWNETGRSNYGHGWHTQNDKLELAIPEYLAQSATNSAVVMFNLACAPELLPRSIEPETADGE